MDARVPHRRLLVGVAAAGLIVIAALGAWAGLFLWQDERNGQALDIPGDVIPPAGPASGGQPAPSGDNGFISGVSENGRYFLDGAGDPILIRGDSPWSLLTDLSPDQARTYFMDRERHGVNAVLLSLVGAEDNGARSADGATYDGVQPFLSGGVLDWNSAYWKRAHHYLEIAAAHGVTAFLYPIDGWTIGTSFVPQSQQECRDYGGLVAAWAADLPNIVWMTGGDYFPVTNDLAEGSDVDHCMNAMLTGIRAQGDMRPFSIQLGYDVSRSTDNPYWAPRVSFNFVYSYYPTYRAVLDAYATEPARPAVFAEGNYEGENNQGDTPPTTNETLRRQVLWALTSGSPGEFYGSDDWEFHDGWESRLDSEGLAQVTSLRDVIASLEWWNLIPDDDHRFLVAGAGPERDGDSPGDVLDDNHATAALTSDGSLALVYVPSARSITLDVRQLAPEVTARWVDPSSGSSMDVELASEFTTPGANADGGEDWLLVVSVPAG